MIRRVAIMASCTAVLALGGLLPALAAVSHTPTGSASLASTASGPRQLSRPGSKVQAPPCVSTIPSPEHDGAAAVGLAFGPGYRHHSSVGAAAVGFGHSHAAPLRRPTKAISSLRHYLARRTGKSASAVT